MTVKNPYKQNPTNIVILCSTQNIVNNNKTTTMDISAIKTLL